MRDQDLSPEFTLPSTIRALEAGSIVPLDATGWADTFSTRCPDCDAPVKCVVGSSVLFVHGTSATWPHVCHDTRPAAGHDSKWLRIDRANQLLDEQARRSTWASEQEYLGGST